MNEANDIVGNEKITNTVKDGLIKTVFKFDEDNKGEMMNIIQYTLLAVIPCLIILKATKSLVPEADDSKGSIEIVFEIVIQLTLMVMALYFVDKIIRYIPTYSKIPYLGSENFNVFLLPFVFLLLTMQTKLGNKVNILSERVVDIYQGNPELKKDNGSSTVTVSQPLAGQHQPSRSDVLDQNQLLPSNLNTTQMPAVCNQENFSGMYQNTTTPLQDAATPSMMEPMAANEGGGGFGSW